MSKPLVKVLDLPGLADEVVVLETNEGDWCYFEVMGPDMIPLTEETIIRELESAVHDLMVQRATLIEMVKGVEPEAVPKFAEFLEMENIQL